MNRGVKVTSEEINISQDTIAWQIRAITKPFPGSIMSALSR